MALGLYMEGNNIMFNNQKVGELSIPEGSVLHDGVVNLITQQALSADELKEIKTQSRDEGYEDGNCDGVSEGHDAGYEEGYADGLREKEKE